MHIIRNLLPGLGASALLLGMLSAPAPADASRTCNAERRACRQGNQWIFKGCKAECKGDFQGDEVGRDACYLGCQNTRTAELPSCDDLRTACQATVDASGDLSCANGCTPDFRQCVRDTRGIRKDDLAACRSTANDNSKLCKDNVDPKACRADVRQVLGACQAKAGDDAAARVAGVCQPPVDACVGISCPAP
jgi:hypothetical protein